MPVEIRPCTITDIEGAKTLPELLATYAEESSIAELGQPEPCFTTYRSLEAAGSLRPIGAFGPELVGFVFLIVYGLPHYAGRRVGSLESFFVLPRARKLGAGLQLLRAAEDQARDLGATALLVSAPHGGRLDAVLPRSGYRPTNRVFARSIA